MIKIANLEKTYRTEEVETVALNKLSFEIKEGEFVAVMGPSGCGKSTLGKAILRLTEPTSGKVIYHNKDLAHLSPEQMREQRKNSDRTAQIARTHPGRSSAATKLRIAWNSRNGNIDHI